MEFAAFNTIIGKPVPVETMHPGSGLMVAVEEEEDEDEVVVVVVVDSIDGP